MTRFTASILLFLLGFNAYAQIVPAELTDFDKLRNMDGLFVVKIGSVFSDTPKEEQDKLYDLTEVIAIANPDKTVDFVFEEGFEIFEQADSVKKIFINKGFSNVKIGLVYIDDYNVKIILNDSDKETYTISLGSFDKNLPQNEIDKILSLPNVKSLELQNPKRTVYVTGIYDDKIAAKEVVLVLISQGISAEVLRFDKGSLSEIDPSKLYTAEEQESIKNHKLNPIAFKTDKVIYRVQIASSSKKVNLAKFKGMNILTYKAMDGTVKYLNGTYYTYAEAFENKSKINKTEYPGVFIVAYKDGKPLKITDLVTKEEYQQLLLKFPPQ